MTPRRSVPAGPAATTRVREGTLRGGLPYLALGEGPVLVVLPGLEPEHANPTGLLRRRELRRRAPYAEHFTVFIVQRPPGLAAGCTMADIADVHADALAEEFGEAVAVLGESTGGSIALQLAVDHPDLVRRLVVVSGACRLSEQGQAVQREQARRTAAGQPRRAMAATAPALAASALTARLLRVLLWLTGPLGAPDDPTDLVRMIAAEDTYDVEADLHRLTAPTLVLGGERDGYYGADLMRRTAAAIPDGQVRIYPRKGHTVAATRHVTTDALDFLLAG